MRHLYFALTFLILCSFPIRTVAQMPNYPLDTTIRAAKEFNLTNLEGLNINSAVLKGDVVVINFWGIKCKPCIQEIPELNKMTAKYEKSKVHFIGITSDSKDELSGFLKNNPFKYKICPTTDYQKLMIDFNEFPAVPIHLIINKSWQIVYRYIGKLEGETLKQFNQTIDKALK